MRVSKQIFPASAMFAAVIVAALTAGCHEQVPQKDAPGGILSGNDYARMRAARNTAVDGNGYSTYKPAKTDITPATAPVATPVAPPAAPATPPPAK